MNSNYKKYGFLLTTEQLDFLTDDQQGFHRMLAFNTFASMAVIVPTHYEKKGFAVDLSVGQFAISIVELAHMWKCDRKTATKVVGMFNQVGILSSEKNNRTSIHTLLSLAFWYVGKDEIPVKNPHYKQMASSNNIPNDGKSNGTPTSFVSNNEQMHSTTHIISNGSGLSSGASESLNFGESSVAGQSHSFSLNLPPSLPGVGDITEGVTPPESSGETRENETYGIHNEGETGAQGNTDSSSIEPLSYVIGDDGELIEIEKSDGNSSPILSE